MRRIIVGPSLATLGKVGLKARRVAICSAFYSAAPLRWLDNVLTASSLTLAVRLDLKDPSLWFTGHIDPAALLQLARSASARGTNVKIFSSRAAHAKLYVGNSGVLIGSANLTMKGFGSGPEIVYFDGENAVATSHRVVRDYADKLTITSFEQIAAFVDKYGAEAAAERAKRKANNDDTDEDKLPSFRTSSAKVMTGTYEDFVSWLDGRAEEAAREIASRARGKSNLQGHIDRNFHGLRQFFLSYPQEIPKYVGEDPDVFRVFANSSLENAIENFVDQNATDEDKFEVDRWRTYLPIELGGRAKKRGGTIGSLNKMVPLVARYLSRKHVHV